MKIRWRQVETANARPNNNEELLVTSAPNVARLGNAVEISHLAPDASERSMNAPTQLRIVYRDAILLCCPAIRPRSPETALVRAVHSSSNNAH